jgi:hypothetical protein
LGAEAFSANRKWQKRNSDVPYRCCCVVSGKAVISGYPWVKHRISSGLMMRMIILIFPNYTMRSDNGKVFLLTFASPKLSQKIMEEIRIFCESRQEK